ncbi:MAG: RNA-binding S4 domain-containing protein [Clostridiales bacterium]|nr:RNA-binding S4 domain-containing protein [Clostridiales bacterium]
MRLDKYLKVSRIIKRRTVANEACSGGRVQLNGKVAKPGADVQAGDILEIRFGNRVGKYEVTQVLDHVRKGEAENMYKVIAEDETVAKERG